MILTAANTYSGGTTVSRATLQLGDGLTANGSVTGNIADNGLLVFANPNAADATPARSAARGAWWPTARACSPSPLPTATAGGTTIGANATLQLGDGSGNNGSVTGNISDNGLLTFTNPSAQSMTGTISRHRRGDEDRRRRAHA